jgi:hypothetical protein
MAPTKQHEWEIYALRSNGRYLGTVEAPDRDAAVRLAIKAFQITDRAMQKRLTAQRVSRARS